MFFAHLPLYQPSPRYAYFQNQILIITAVHDRDYVVFKYFDFLPSNERF